MTIPLSCSRTPSPNAPFRTKYLVDASRHQRGVHQTCLKDGYIVLKGAIGEGILAQLRGIVMGQ
eukprot:605543-Pyramimonas_sp.AAC.1